MMIKETYKILIGFSLLESLNQAYSSGHGVDELSLHLKGHLQDLKRFFLLC